MRTQRSTSSAIFFSISATSWSPYSPNAWADDLDHELMLGRDGSRDASFPIAIGMVCRPRGHCSSCVGWSRARRSVGSSSAKAEASLWLPEPQIDQIAGTLMMVRSPRVWSCSRLALTSSTQASTASRLGNS